jgi:hypothetical protein
MNRTKGLVYFWVSVIILSAANSVLAKLGIEGAKHLINGRNPISFCNVLFTSNLIAGITIFLVRWKAWNHQNFVSISTMKWLQMFFYLTAFDRGPYSCFWSVNAHGSDQCGFDFVV